MGFFFAETTTKSAKKKTIPINIAKELECKACPNNTNPLLKTPKFSASGVKNPVIYVLYSRPLSTDDYKGEHFSDALFQDILWTPYLEPLWKEGLLRINTTIRCHREGTISEIEQVCCRRSIEKDIEESKPAIILGIGIDPLRWCLNEGSVENWHARYAPIKIGTHVCWFYCLPDPYFIKSKRYVKENKDGTITERKGEWDQTLKHDFDKLDSLLETLSTTQPTWYTTKQIKENCDYTYDKQKILKWLKHCETVEELTYDIETTGLRPYETNSKILTVALGTFEETLAFPLEYDNAWSKDDLNEIKSKLKKTLTKAPKVIGHNVKFEIEWTAYKLGQELLWTVNWQCTQALAYLLDERRGMLSLDILCKLYFGFNLKEISSHIDRAHMEAHTLEEILPYNALDVRWTNMLWKQLMKAYDAANDALLCHARDNLNAALPALTLAQMTGIEVDRQLLTRYEREHNEKIEKLIKQIKQLDEVYEYEGQYGTFNPGSPHHLLKIFRDSLKLDLELKDKKGKHSTSEPTLAALRDEYKLADLILKLRAEQKKLSTYIAPLADYIFKSDNKIHTNFNPFETGTGRLSSSSPNVQQFPNRRGKEIRQVIIPPEGHWMVSADYGQIEARIIAIVSQDPIYCEALWHDFDIHLEWAKKIAEAWPAVIGGRKNLNNEKIIAKFRKDIKNQWTFPAFYGSSIYSIAKAIGLPKDIAFDLFNEFWDTFREVKKWQKWTIDFYERHGYVQTLTGRRRHGPLTFNAIINSGIQGTASDFCVFAMTRLAKAGVKIVMNIHDDITSIVHEDDLEKTCELIPEIMCDVPYKWINVPIAVELSVGKNWGEQEEIGVFTSTDYKKVDSKLYKIGHYQNML